MSDIAVRVENISKLYNIGVAYRHDSLRDQLTDWFRSLFVGNGHASSEGASQRSSAHHFWALKDVSFEVKRGEVVGIIGRNGAGKSTLLKILSRITAPTSGFVEMKGRVGSLLEVGTGFHRDLTGRENIYLNGAILGMRKAEIDRRFDEIVDFSGVEKFIDTPVKRYSSGMYVRLAFSVAAHLDPEILILDEVLAVGDAEFQKKCLQQMENVAREGRTVLFVSHNLGSVENLCHRGIALREGKIVFSGTATEAVDFYLRSVGSKRQIQNSHVVDLSEAPGRPAGLPASLQRVEFYTDGGEPLKGELKMGGSLTARIHFRLDKPASRVDGTLAFNTLAGDRLFTAHSSCEPNRPSGTRAGDQVFVCRIPSLILVPGDYQIKVSIDADDAPVDKVEDATRLRIINFDYYGTGAPLLRGVFVLKNHWHLE